MEVVTKNKADKLFFVLVLASIIVLGFRAFKANRISLQEKHNYNVLSVKNGTISLDCDFFSKEVIERHPRVKQTPVHLVVFMDPATDCPACLYEMNDWVMPLSKTSTYGLTFFAPKDVPKDIIDRIMDEHNLATENFVYFTNNSPLAAFHRLGVFKVILNQVHGISWVQLGSQSPKEYKAFAQRLRAEIQEFDPSF